MKLQETLTKLRALPDHQKKAVTFSVVGVLAIIGGALWLNHFVQQVPEITQGIAESIAIPEVVQDIPLATETQEWQTYRNEEYGFEIQYPTDWKVAKTIFDTQPSFVFCPPELASNPDQEIICNTDEDGMYMTGMIYLYGDNGDQIHPQSFLGSANKRNYHLESSNANQSIYLKMSGTFSEIITQ